MAILSKADGVLEFSGLIVEAKKEKDKAKGFV